ncbi:formimidoylglutamate deiminase [Dictyobacter aurantiacus]|uniref:Formimidoylglutamate deiminase n=1 Tax=Dictyobacter aurantiacus TaxID=1936993 RepID=A0A401ZIR7_9CHLR|nr:formimidoylglutamate deiminase [Dictyobacter aurantiacus]GCE06724.1 formimidoylglutamate deiminase [Dictyobacter aurantiacus]
MKGLAPDYVYTPQGLLANQVVRVSDEGMIVEVVERVEGMEVTEEMPGLALLPGFVNTHSHAFQRGLRGHTQRRLSVHDTFWTWRNAMYAQAQRLTPESIYEISRQVYGEMLASGYTSVGEFHYVHHRPDGRPYAHPNALAQAVVQAGRDAGIRVVLLLTAYARGDFKRPPSDEQRRFCDASLVAYLERAEALRISGIPCGIAPHSVRAVPPDWLEAIADYSRQYQLPFHIHADEQRAEIEQCLEAEDCRPIELLRRCSALGPLTTVVHATHADEHEITLLAEAGATVCVCPTTEGDLGDGIAPYAELVQASIPLTIGSDSNTRLDPFEELRWAEYSARMRYQRRRVLIPDGISAPGPLLFAYGTRYGAQALGLQTGLIAPGLAADFIAIDLKAPALDGWTPQDLPDVLCFGASANQVIKQTWVQGRRVWSV